MELTEDKNYCVVTYSDNQELATRCAMVYTAYVDTETFEVAGFSTGAAGASAAAGGSAIAASLGSSETIFATTSSTESVDESMCTASSAGLSGEAARFESRSSRSLSRTRGG